MGISIQYQPGAGVTSQAAWLGGYGQYRKWAEEQAMRAAQMQQQERMQQSQIAASMQQAADNRNFQANEMNWRAGLQQQQALWQQQMQNAQNANHFEQQKQLLGIQDTNRMNQLREMDVMRQRGFAADDQRKIEEAAAKRKMIADEVTKSFNAHDAFMQDDEELLNFRNQRDSSQNMVLSPARQQALASLNKERDAFAGWVRQQGHAMPMEEVIRKREDYKRREMALTPDVKKPTPEEEIAAARKTITNEVGEKVTYIKDQKTGNWEREMPEKTNPALENKRLELSFAQSILGKDTSDADAKRAAKAILKKHGIEPLAEEPKDTAAEPQDKKTEPPPPEQPKQSTAGWMVDRFVDAATGGAAPLFREDGRGVQPSERSDATKQQPAPPREQRQFVPVRPEQKKDYPGMAGTVGGVIVLEEIPGVSLTDHPQYKRLRSGQQFITPSGKIRVKP